MTLIFSCQIMEKISISTDTWAIERLYKRVVADSVVILYIYIYIYTHLFAVMLYIPVCRYNYFYLFDETIRARYIEVVADAMIRLGDQTLQCLVDQKKNVLWPRTLNGHRQLTVTAEEK